MTETYPLTDDDIKSLDRESKRLPPDGMLTEGERRCINRNHDYICNDCRLLWGLAGAGLFVLSLHSSDG